MKVYKTLDLSFAGAYKKLLYDLIHIPDFISAPRGQKINEILGASLEFSPEKCLYENERRSSQLKYIAAELVWYFNKSNDVNFINKFSKFWNQITNPDNRTVNSAYGHLIFNELHSTNWRDDNNDEPSFISQWQWAYKQLIADKDTRQAILHYNKPHHQYLGNKDFVCTMYQTFHIRDNKLYSHVHMRSNDVILGLPTDVAWFSILQINLYKLLLKVYPDLELGTMTHISDSIHFYERHDNLISEMLESEFNTIELPDIPICINENNTPSQFINELYYNIMDSENFNISEVTSDFDIWMLEKLNIIKKH